MAQPLNIEQLIDQIRLSLQGTAKNANHKLWGPDGPPWGTSFADLEELAVGIGSVVDIETESGDTMTVEISAVGGTGTVSPTSPLGVALLGRAVGDTVDVEAPRGAWRATVRRIH